MTFRRILTGAAVALALAAATAAPGQAQTLRLALAGDPDALDPTTGRSLYGRIVFAALCDKLFDTDANLNIVPQLATGYEWSDGNTTLTIRLRAGVRFHDGAALDAEAVKLSLERHLTFQGSQRRSEISVVRAIEIVDPLTVRLRLSAPFVPLLAQFTDRAGMIMSPQAIQGGGANFGTRPVCAGPFRFVERVAQDRIVLERFADYWNKDAIHLERVVYRPMPDSTVRLTNLQGGGVDFVETVAASDIPTVRRNARLSLVTTSSLGFRGIQFNVAHGEAAAASPMSNPRIREAFDLSLDRDVLNQVAFGGAYIADRHWAPPGTPYHVEALRAQPRDVARARAILREVGQPNPSFRLMVQNAADWLQAAEVIQSMAREAGFDVRIQATEFATSLAQSNQGRFDAFLTGWSGRPDPDGNIYAFLRTGGTNNDGRYSNATVDRLLDEARTVSDLAARQRLYGEASAAIAADRPWIFLYHVANVHAFTTRITGFTPHPDGLVRLQGVRMAAN
ncbi:MAG: ABC transporter substrate-binding protein [Alphaproteobacteria bacterium]|nr:ABC transporter substrate-binding protein [Alphaproteobacteria bacterium]